IFVFGNLDYSNLFSLAPYINTDILTFISLCLLIGVMAKSAQLGLLQALNFDNIYNLFIIYYSRFRTSLYAGTSLEPKVPLNGYNLLGLDNQQESEFNKFSIITNSSSNKNLIKNSTEKEQEFTNKDFIEWFIGFTEGDGSFIITK